ncbi:MAG TPA: lytic murein transglycosylase [Alphaproteobacteria bacterium]|nr:lytic murein transglycosylase [Alphaproteobacteria bacterium]
MTALRRLTAAALLSALLASPAQAAGDFGSWLRELRQEAASAGISARTLDAALTGIAPIPRVLELDRKQPEGTMTYEQYRTRILSETRIANGRSNLQRHRAMLDQVSQRYGVPAKVIVALWGIETAYGTNMGSFSIVEALATLAYDGRRSEYFRKELLAALKIIDQGDISAAAMKGSWAGAMGQSQFMPTSYQSYAVDFNGDGRRDIWGTQADVFASAANYLAKAGWKSGVAWGQAVVLPAGFDPGLVTLDTRKPLADWLKAGVRLTGNGNALGASSGLSLVQPGGASGPTFLVSENYRAILRWNRSSYFATSVGQLADLIGAP